MSQSGLCICVSRHVHCVKGKTGAAYKISILLALESTVSA